MSNINFPTSPYPGQTYTFNGNTWTWNGYTWTSQGISGPTGPTGATGSQGVQGIQGPTGPSIILIRESDYVYPYQYSGTAIDGTLTSDPGWTIKRINFTTPGSPITQQATGAWTSRTSLIYT